MLSDKLIWLRHQLSKQLIGTIMPVSWFGPKPPAIDQLSIAGEPVHLQIVSHCWQYAHMLNFQLSSIINNPPKNLKLTYTLYHSAEDTKLKLLIDRIDKVVVPNVTWDWVELTTAQLLRRAIGRNQSALNTTADWIWFSDCDLIFHIGCLDSVATAVKGCQQRMVFPKQEFITDLLDASHPMLNQSNDSTIDIDTSLFKTNTIHKAKGAFQIVHGDVARTCGYCRDMKAYQAPMQHWSKTYEDSIFRKLIASEGEPITVKGLYRIRHIEKGRYVKDSQFSKLRQGIRVATDDSGKQT